MRAYKLFAAFSIGIATTCAGWAGVGIPVVITPQNMAEQKFSIECRFVAQTIKEGDTPTRPTGVVMIQVIFDPEKGTRITELDSAALVIKQDQQTIWIPVQWSPGARPGFIQFAIPETMIGNATIVLNKSGEQNPQAYAVALSKFRK